MVKRIATALKDARPKIVADLIFVSDRDQCRHRELKRHLVGDESEVLDRHLQGMALKLESRLQRHRLQPDDQGIKGSLARQQLTRVARLLGAHILLAQPARFTFGATRKLNGSRFTLNGPLGSARPALDRVDAQQQKFALHVLMNGASELVPPRTHDGEADCYCAERR